MVSIALRNEALRMLDGKGDVLRTAREVSALLRKHRIDGAVIGGVAVVLHGHVRTTRDVDVYAPAPVERTADVLRTAGFRFDPVGREFVRELVPVHLVTLDQVEVAPARFEEIDDVRTVELGELISLKLRSGMRSVLRAQDLADVIGLIRSRRLTPAFAAAVDKALRPEFCKLVKAVRDESPG